MSRHRAAVVAELDRILESPAFRNSHQSQRLLRHLVERSLEGRFEELRERTLAVELFGRETGFDANSDPIVRVRANDVRKRLHRYYDSLPAAPDLKFQLPPGAYRVEILPALAADAATAAAPPPPVLHAPEAKPPVRRRSAWVAAAALAALSLAAATLVFLWPHREPIDQFWSPLFSQEAGRVIVCTGHPVVYRFSREFLRTSPGAVVFPGTETGIYRPKLGELIDGRHIVPVEDQYTGLGSAQAMARVAAWVATHGHGADIRFGHDISLTDLKQSSAVLLGFANRWTLSFTNQLRFVPHAAVNSMPSIRDQQTGKTWVLHHLTDDGRTEEDYVVVTRTFSSESGRGIVAVAGLTQYGTQAGGELVTNPALMREILQNLPPDWQSRNLQILLHVKVVGHAPAAPRFLAYHLW
ncbi:MAG: hypothetical protein SFV54_00150 [Bryobacteraceae bacterium]|nr:hypothetical protein [Bryobacteraceae bacterium]